VGTVTEVISDKICQRNLGETSAPLGGDQQIGSRIAEREVDLLVFFWDPLSAEPHEPDVRALLRLAVLANISVACNRATADFVICSPLLGDGAHAARSSAAEQAPGHRLSTPVPADCFVGRGVSSRCR
jgi:methylglyoxal synthase